VGEIQDGKPFQRCIGRACPVVLRKGSDVGGGRVNGKKRMTGMRKKGSLPIGKPWKRSREPGGVFPFDRQR